MDDILDDFDETKIATFKVTHFIVPFLISLLFLYSLYIRFTIGYELYLTDWIGYAGLLIITVLYFVKERIYVYGMTLLLLLGALNCYSLTPFHISFRFMGIPIEPITLVLMITHLSIFNEYLKPKITSKDQLEKEFKEKVNSFKSKFETRTKTELEAIMHTSGYRKEAKQAAQELLLEKYSNNSQESN